MNYPIRFLSSPEEIRQVEHLQKAVWGKGEAVVYHMLLAAVHNGGLLMGAFDGNVLVGFVFGFPGLKPSSSGPRLHHVSHMLAVHPDYRDQSIGFALKRAQWQWVRRQGVERITWTYDPLQSRNANLNIGKLGAVCNSYAENYYGDMSDHVNAGLPSDRFQVDWWVNTPRVDRRLGKHARRRLELGDYFSGGAEIVNPTKLDDQGWPRPPKETWSLSELAASMGTSPPEESRLLPKRGAPSFYLVEIPANFLALKAADPDLALRWRLHTRTIFTDLFARGYLVTDFVFMSGESPRSFYVLSDGERRLGGFKK